MLNATAPASGRQSPRAARASNGRSRAARAQHALGVLLRTGRLPAFLVALGMAALLYGFMFSSDFLIASVQVRGTKLGDPAEVALVADALGESIFRIDAGHAAERVAVLPYVERVTVETRFPDRVAVTVTERTPVLLWQSGVELYLVDERGNVIGPAASSPLQTLVVEGLSPVSGEALDERVVAATLAIQEALGSRLGRLDLSMVDGLSATLLNGRQVIFGDAAEVPLKLSILAEVERQGELWTLLDLREPGRPYYK